MAEKQLHCTVFQVQENSMKCILACSSHNHKAANNIFFYSNSIIFWVVLGTKWRVLQCMASSRKAFVVYLRENGM